MAMHSEPLHNGVLRALRPEDLQILLPACAHRKLKPGEVLEHRMQAVEKVFFPTNGVASVVARGKGGRELETGPIGWEGMTGLPVIYGVEMSTTETLVQIGGHALAAPAAVIRDLIAQSPAAKQVFNSYAYAFSLQVIHTALAGSLSDVETRLARWILMLHDRIEGDAIPVTHEFVAMMLGVRRPGVTVAMPSKAKN